MTQLDNRKEPSQGPVGGSEAPTVELEPCPFCRHATAPKVTAASDLFRDDDEEPGPYMHSESYAVVCDASKPGGPGGCGCQGGFKPTEAEAIAAWNRRATAAAPAAPVRQDAWLEKAELLLDTLLFAAASRDGTAGAARTLIVAHLRTLSAPPAAVGQALTREQLKRWWDAMRLADEKFMHAAIPSVALRAAMLEIDAAIAALSVQAEVPAVVDAQDAARYRLLRAGNDYEREGPMVLWYEKDSDTGERPYWSLASDALDSVVDAAMRAADTKEGN